MRGLFVAAQFLIIPATLALVVPLKTYACVDNVCQLNARDVEGGISHGICLTTCGAGNIWPKPTGDVSISSEYSLFSLGNINVEKMGHLFLDRMISESFVSTVSQIFSERGSHPVKDSKTTVSLQFKVQDTSIIMADYNNDESYSLSVTTDISANTIQVVISSVTFFGARHGVETLTQLISYDYLNHALAIPSTVSIVDAPAFPYRGVMIDVSRNFISIPKLKENIRAMGYNKMNVLHLHVSDTASFPLTLNSQPNVTSYGAYDNTRYFTTADMEELVVFANLYGVMIMPEVDTPAHVAAGWQWGPSAGLGDLAICTDPEGTGGKQWKTDSLEPPSGHINIANENVYPILGDVYSEIIQLFQSNYFHMGGDEVIVGSDSAWAACWNSTTLGKDIIAKVEELGLDRSEQSSFYFLWSEFTKRATGLVKAGYTKSAAINKATQQLKKLHMWGAGSDASGVTYNMMLQSDVTTTLPPELFTIQVWDTTSNSISADLINQGYDIILSNTDYVYLDCGNAGNVAPGGYWCQPYHEWYHIYQYVDDVRKKWSLTDDQMKHVSGSETLIWTEMVDDANLSQKVWPRSAALAEALWSDPTEGWYPAAGRFLQWRDTMSRRGIYAEGMAPKWCSQRDAYACFIRGGTPQ